MRQDIQAPANVAMLKYFDTQATKRRGRPKTSIVSTLRQDLKRIKNTHWPHKLNTKSDLERLRTVADNRREWKHLATTIYRSAQAEESDDISADGS